MRRGIHIASALCVMGAFGARDARADEVFCDPENPSCQSSEPQEAGGSGDDEVFCDPENPSCASSGSDSDPAPVLVEPDFGQQASVDASYRASWGSTLLVDTGWEGSGEDVVEWANTLDLGLSYELDANTKLVVSGQLRHWIGGEANPDAPDYLLNASNVRGELDVRLGESYARWRSGGLALRVGTLITSWGSTDLTRPGDVINPKDTRAWGAQPAGQGALAPQPAAELSWSWEGGSLTAVFVPFFVADQVVLYGRDSGLLDGDHPIARRFPVGELAESLLLDMSSTEEFNSFASQATYPDETLFNPSGGVRLAATAWNADMAISYFVGFNRTPMTFVDEDARTILELAVEDGQVLSDLDLLAFLSRNPEAQRPLQRLQRNAQAGEPAFSTSYERRQTLLVDAARYFGPIGVRADVAFSPAQVFNGSDLNGLRRPTFSSALGLGYERLDEERALAIALEGFWIEPLSREHPLTEAFVPEEQRGAPGVEPLVIGDRLFGVALGGQWQTPLWGLNLELGGVYNVTTRDVIARGSVSKWVAPWLEVKAGAVVYEGPDPEESLSFGGIFDRNDQAFVSVGGAL